MAQTHLFFRPTQIEDGVLASSFRGRGLLATQEKEGTDTDEVRNENHALLLSLEENQIQFKVSISNFVEWHHEHSIKSLKYKEKESNRIQAANEWIEISNSVSVATDASCVTAVFVVDVAILRAKSILNLIPFSLCINIYILVILLPF
jgi:hypothetical protein